MKDVKFDIVEQLQSEGKKLLVDFSANWCGPCKTLKPILENVEKNYSDVEFLSVDIDNNKDAAVKLGIRAVPTVMVFDGQSLVKTLLGVLPDSHYREILDTL